MRIEMDKKIKSLPNSILRFSLRISKIRIEELVNEPDHYKLLLNRKQRNNSNHHILVKILIPKRLELRISNNINTNNTVKINKHTTLSKNHDGYIIRYSKDFHINELENTLHSYILSIVDINFGIKYEFPYSVIDLKNNSKKNSKKIISPTEKKQRKKAKQEKKQMIKQNRINYLMKENYNTQNKKTNNNEQQVIWKEEKSEKGKNIVKENKVLSTPKIWIANDTSFKRCGHCNSYNASLSKCYRHKQTVSKNNGCKDFYFPKTYLGGAMSPR
ncbi:hypothetical protein [Niallia sp. BSM11]|uniref:hypothetical protein n=1 Tax=Niallia sp. BSM11 TaxID=3391576 RepID=UPI003984CC58